MSLQPRHEQSDSRSRPAKLSKVHFSRKFQGRVHLNFWLSGSPISPYFHPLHEQAFPKCGIFVLKKCFLRMLVHVTYHYSI